jgi:prepilin-type N-terminal cleavage/methylation domain-containing protein
MQITTRHRQQGVTLIELLVTMSILVILLTVGVGGMTTVVKRNTRATEVNTMIGHLNFARAQAVMRATTVRVCPSTPATWPPAAAAARKHGSMGMLSSLKTTARSCGSRRAAEHHYEDPRLLHFASGTTARRYPGPTSPFATSTTMPPTTAIAVAASCSLSSWSSAGWDAYASPRRTAVATIPTAHEAGTATVRASWSHWPC